MYGCNIMGSKLILNFGTLICIFMTSDDAKFACNYFLISLSPYDYTSFRIHVNNFQSQERLKF